MIATDVATPFLTPPDVFSQMLLAIPMWGLWELGLFFARFYVKEESEDKQEQTEEGSEGFIPLFMLPFEEYGKTAFGRWFSTT